MASITIRIEGDAGAGKSTLGQHLAYNLKNFCGMDVVLLEAEPSRRSGRSAPYVEQEISGSPINLAKRRSIRIIVGEEK